MIKAVNTIVQCEILKPPPPLWYRAGGMQGIGICSKDQGQQPETCGIPCRGGEGSLL